MYLNIFSTIILISKIESGLGMAGLPKNQSLLVNALGKDVKDLKDVNMECVNALEEEIAKRACQCLILDLVNEMEEEIANNLANNPAQLTSGKSGTLDAGVPTGASNGALHSDVPSLADSHVYIPRENTGMSSIHDLMSDDKKKYSGSKPNFNMAASGVDENELVKKFEEFCTLAGSKDKTQMTPKANGKLATDCFEKAGYKKYDVKTICDASVFPVCKEKGKPNMTVNKANVHKYLHKVAHEIAKRKTKNTKISDDDDEVKTIEADLEKCVCSGGPQVKVVKQSATGNVGALTDTSKYTGAHKERFDESGKGKGIDGRVEKADSSGYVGNYKGAGTYDKK